MKYLMLVGLLGLGVLAGCQDSTYVTPHKGQILSMNYDEDGDAEVVYQINGKSYTYDYRFDEGGQVDKFHVGDKIICYVDENGDVNEIAKN